jgi:hypothetical protein
MGRVAMILSPTITHTGYAATGATPSVANLLLRVGDGDKGLYATKRGSRPLIGVARIVSQLTPQYRSRRSR